MNTTSFARFAAVAAATGFASLALCAPANAIRVLEPNAEGTASTEGSTPATSGAASDAASGTNWTLVATGVGGGILVVSAGAVVAGKRRHAGHSPHPA